MPDIPTQKSLVPPPMYNHGEYVINLALRLDTKFFSILLYELNNMYLMGES